MKRRPLSTPFTPRRAAPRWHRLAAGAIAALSIAASFAARSAEPAAIAIGLSADMSAGAAESGESIKRGIELAMDEINGQGGLLGRRLRLIAQDHRGIPARGKDHADDFLREPNLVAVFGGLHSSVIMSQMDILNANRILFLVPWAAATKITSNGYSPNYVFRVSVRDEYAGEFLVRETIKLGYRSPGLLLEDSTWGRSNRAAMEAALARFNASAAGVRWFTWSTRNMAEAIEQLRASGADSILLVANPPEGIDLAQTMAARSKAERLPIISHWGFTGGPFAAEVGDALKDIELLFLQTFSFLAPRHPDRAGRLLGLCRAKYRGCETARSVRSPVGMAQAYDLMHMLASAIRAAGTVDREVVRAALEALPRHAGVVRDYAPPFTPEMHDALTLDDFFLAYYESDGAIVPFTK